MHIELGKERGVCPLGTNECLFVVLRQCFQIQLSSSQLMHLFNISWCCSKCGGSASTCFLLLIRSCLSCSCPSFDLCCCLWSHLNWTHSYWSTPAPSCSDWTSSVGCWRHSVADCCSPPRNCAGGSRAKSGSWRIVRRHRPVLRSTRIDVFACLSCWQCPYWHSYGACSSWLRSLCSLARLILRYWPNCYWP